MSLGGGRYLSLGGGPARFGQLLCGALFGVDPLVLRRRSSRDFRLLLGFEATTLGLASVGFRFLRCFRLPRRFCPLRFFRLSRCFRA
ncbi:MAG: hypothetical protein KDJ12_09550, partial [Hyphomicrobiales bacterium]|nr:hypothetical protein [Hyphomicrobiales bacterium]